jgi:phage/conjugal plasmid C-4 type zinc finger TraR family protein
MTDALDLADERIEQERQAGVADVRRRLAEPGTIICLDCDQEIPAERRRALPSAVRCVACQEHQEHNARKGEG